MSESDPIDLSNLQNLEFRPSWAKDMGKSDAAAGEVIWGRAPGGPSRDRDERARHGGGPRREGGRPFGRDDRGARPDRRGPRPEFRGAPGHGERRPPPRGDSHGPPPRQERREGGPEQRGPRPERREFQGGRRDDRGPHGRPPFRGERRDFREDREYRDMPPPLPGWHVKLIPDHRSVEAIARQIKASGRAFSVFDVGRLFMESRDRYQVRFIREQSPPAKVNESAQAPQSNRPGPEEIFQCRADGSLWLTRDEAIRHLLQSPALTKYYRAETVTVDAPKGHWNSIAVCGFSGTLLGPPNHHDFQRNVARMHRERFSDMPLERYKSRIRTEKDEALLQKWQESQSSATQYVPVTEEPLPEGAEPPAPLKSVAEMEAHFLKHHAADAAVPLTRAAVPGNIPGKFLSAPLLGLLRAEVERQQRFPMQLVQDLCRDLESQGLRFFKRDKKTTFVCRNRPHFLPDDLVLSDRIRVMVEMVRANPGITYSRLVSTLAPDIVPASAARPAVSEPASVETDAKAGMEPEAALAEPAAAPAEPSAPEAQAPGPVTTVEEASTDRAEAAEIETASPASVEDSRQAPEPSAAAESAPASVAGEPPAPVEASAETSVSAETAPAPGDTPEAKPESEIAGDAREAAAPAAVETALKEAPDADAGTAVAEATHPVPPATATPAPPHLSPEEITILQDLHWLVQEGYVTEFQNGELWVLGRPPQPAVERKPRPPRPPKPGMEIPPPSSGKEGETAAPEKPDETAPNAETASTELPASNPAAEEVGPGEPDSGPAPVTINVTAPAAGASEMAEADSAVEVSSEESPVA